MHGADAGRSLRISASGFDPTEILIRRGDPVRLDVESGDGEEHCFAVDELRVERRVSAGRKTRVDLIAERAGRLASYCCLHGLAVGDRERGTLVVSE